ncbi:flagellar hook-basal body protein [Geobacillus thermodenitrificans]|uniref:flagellar hook-basal body protein n=1 Tax=Geobacillus thermodenitrificans TaxID=33940 RepID=UPI002E0BECDF|nr:flagellar basal-body rod protein FlgG [Geobacillus thermodenitrificans]MED0663315.1 flagellar biosynthesis protein FlgG [Geobacillus thermodenitrificans]
MLRSMHTAANTMNALQQRLDTLSHNIANSNTTGFKRREASFAELLTQQVDRLPDDEAPRQTPAGVRYGNGAGLASTMLVTAQGPLTETGRALDFAFTAANQWFRVRVTDGNGVATIGYTRAGNFSLTPIGDRLALVTSDGRPVLDETNAPIELPTHATGFQLSPTGTLTATDANGAVVARVNLGVTVIRRPQLLEALGDNVFTLPTAPGATQELNGNLRSQIAMKQGALEQSNVDLGEELIGLMATTRAYQLNARAISISEQMLGLINNLRSS